MGNKSGKITECTVVQKTVVQFRAHLTSYVVKVWATVTVNTEAVRLLTGPLAKQLNQVQGSFKQMKYLHLR